MACSYRTANYHARAQFPRRAALALALCWRARVRCVPPPPSTRAASRRRLPTPPAICAPGAPRHCGGAAPEQARWLGFASQ